MSISYIHKSGRLTLTLMKCLILYVTVCKTCIVKHLDEHNTCPKCNEVIHQSHPKEHIRFDRTLQSIVYKVC